MQTDNSILQTPHEIVGDILDIECPFTLQDVYAATKRLQNFTHKTPLEHSTTLSKMTGCNVYLKLETFQKTGSFKVRGATNKILSLSVEERKRGVVAASAGNHAQGVAFASTKCGCQSTIVMPETASAAKVAATSGYGAEVVLTGKVFDESLVYALNLCKEKGKTFVHPYNDKDVMAGQGTIAIEILDQLATADVIIGAVGGGGLMAGVGYTAKQINPKIRVIGVQAANAPSSALSFREKKMCKTFSASTMADGIAVKCPGDLTTSVNLKYLDDLVTVDEETISHAMMLMMERCKIVAEGAGSCPLAALLANKIPGLTENTNVVCIVSGGNVDYNMMNRVVERGFVRTGKRVEFTLEIDDVANAVKDLMNILENENASVMTIKTKKLVINNTTVCLCDILMECHGDEHREKIFNVLKEKEYKIHY